MPSPALTYSPNIMTHVDDTLRTLGFDLKGLVKAFDLQTVGLLTILVVAAVFLFDIFNYGYSSYSGAPSSYTSYGRSLVTNVAKVWDQRGELGLASDLRNGRDLDSMTQILDSLADAVIKYDRLDDNEVGQTRQSKDL